MNNLGKFIIGLSLIPSSVLLAATDQQTDISLDAYLESYHPQLHSDLKSQGIDLIAVEMNAESNINSDNKALDTDLPEIKPPESRESCKKNKGFFLENNYIATCVSEDGTFGNGDLSIGMTFNSTGGGTISSPDYLQPGTPHEYFSVAFDGKTYTNNNSTGPAVDGSDNIPTGIKRLDRYISRAISNSSQTGGVLVISKIQGQSRDQHLSMTQKYTLDPNSREIIVRVEMHNDGRRDINNLQYARGLDPDQDIRSNINTHATINRIGHSFNFFPSLPILPVNPVDVSPRNIAWAEGKATGLSVALYSVDPVKHNTCISSPEIWTTEPSAILSRECGLTPQPIYDRPNGVSGFDYSDSTINIAFSVGNLKAGEKRTFSYKYIFDKRNINPPA